MVGKYSFTIVIKKILQNKLNKKYATPIWRKFLNTLEKNEDMNQWKDNIPYSWMGWLNIIMIPILLKIIYKFNAVSIKIPTCYVMAYTTWY